MPSNDPFLPDHIPAFIDDVMKPGESKAARDLRKATKEMPGTIQVMNMEQPISVMGISEAQGRFIEQLARKLGAEHKQPLRAIDVGTFTGLSTLHMAQAIQTLPQGGRIISCDKT